MAQWGRCHVLSKIQGWRNGRGGIGILAVEGLILGTLATAVAVDMGNLHAQSRRATPLPLARHCGQLR